MKRIIYFILGLFILSSCNKSNQFEISGSINNGEGKDLTFSELLINGTEDIKTIKLDKKGDFKFKSSGSIPGFYNLSVSKNNFLTLLIEPGEKVTVKAEASRLSIANIGGSEGSLQVQKINNQLANTKHKLDSVLEYAESIKDNPEFGLKLDEINSAYSKIVDDQRDSSIAFIINNLNSLASIVALYQRYDEENYVLYKNRDLQYIKIVSESLGEKYPESMHVKTLLVDKESLFNTYNQIKTNKILNEYVKDNEVAGVPDIILPDQNGDSISLNSINSKYILLTFWASWSKESIQHNIALLDIYAKYHAKGFEIYQVSLDTKTESWKRLIKFDRLPWINVIDLNGRTSYSAKIYNVKTLPTSYLINPEGDIVLINPSGKQLISTFDYALK
ncbi:MAG: redoxin domain-containing protein [Bacteroidales bacterium]|nr:redoxin domain-containing protein [Bacteroidales bacterium]